MASRQIHWSPKICVIFASRNIFQPPICPSCHRPHDLPASVATLTAVSLANTFAMELSTTSGCRSRSLMGEQTRCLNLRCHVG